jgi:hypothetical protein
MTTSDRLTDQLAAARKTLLALDACASQLRELIGTTHRTLEEAEAVLGAGERWDDDGGAAG